jgi:hypothetical protein
MITLEAIRDYAYSKPGAVLSSICTGEFGYEFYGIQRDFKKGPAWFAGAFTDETARFHALYFCHDPATVDQLHRQHPQLKAADGPVKNRSKIYSNDNAALPALLSFIDQSYEIVLGKMSKQLQAQIKLIANQPNAFSYFSQLTQELTQFDTNWQVQMISNWGFPLIHYRLPGRDAYVGRFAHNRLLLGELLDESQASSADRQHEWKDLILARKDEILRATK